MEWRVIRQQKKPFNFNQQWIEDKHFKPKQNWKIYRFQLQWKILTCSWKWFWWHVKSRTCSHSEWDRRNVLHFNDTTKGNFLKTAPHVVVTDPHWLPGTDWKIWCAKDTLKYLSHTDTAAKYPSGADRQPNAQELDYPRTKFSHSCLAVLLEQN